jgi:hypothetical protein
MIARRPPAIMITMRRVCGVVVVVLAFTSSARAEDEMPNAVPTVLYKPWALAMAYGSDFTRARADDMPLHKLFFFEFALRYRVLRPLEVGLSIGGRFKPAFGYATIYADLRYRLLAEAAWNPYVLGGVGIAKIEYGGPWHLIMHAGVGLERRFISWAFATDIQLERAAGDGKPMPYFLDDQGELEHFGLVSVSVTLAATYYWGSGGHSRHRFVP